MCSGRVRPDQIIVPLTKGPGFVPRCYGAPNREDVGSSERGSNCLITHSTSVVTLVRGLGRSYVVSYHVKSGAKGSANMAELNVMAKHPVPLSSSPPSLANLAIFMRLDLD